MKFLWALLLTAAIASADDAGNYDLASGGSVDQEIEIDGDGKTVVTTQIEGRTGTNPGGAGGNRDPRIFGELLGLFGLGQNLIGGLLNPLGGFNSGFGGGYPGQGFGGGLFGSGLGGNSWYGGQPTGYGGFGGQPSGYGGFGGRPGRPGFGGGFNQGFGRR